MGRGVLVAVACNEPVGIQTALGRQWVEVRQVEALLLQEQDWQRLSMSEGTKGPRTFDWACVPILHRWQDDGRHWLLIRRNVDKPSLKAYYFVFGPLQTTLEEIVHAIGARWRVEEVFEGTKAMGLDQYEVRTWTSWFAHFWTQFSHLWYSPDDDSPIIERHKNNCFTEECFHSLRALKAFYVKIVIPL